MSPARHLIQAFEEEAERLEQSAERIESFIPSLPGIPAQERCRALANSSRQLAAGYREQAQLVKAMAGQGK